MGYESKIIIVRKGHLTNEDGMRYATKLVEFDLSKAYGLSDYLTHRPATDCYYYADGLAYEVGTHLGAHHIGKVIALVMSYGREYARFIDLAEHIESIVKYLDNKVTQIEKGAN